MTRYHVYRVCAAITAVICVVIASGAGNKFVY
jgi:hypothetical protein